MVLMSLNPEKKIIDWWIWTIRRSWWRNINPTDNPDSASPPADNYDDAGNIIPAEDSDSSGAASSIGRRLFRYLASSVRQKCKICKEGYLVNSERTCDKCSVKFENCEKCTS